MRTTITSLLTSFIVVIATLFSSCVRDLDGGEKAALLEASDSAALVTLSLSMPASPATRTPGTKVENNVSTVDVLLFTTNNDKYYYRAAGIDIKKDPS
ncbi:MAG: hypothetical protein LBF09_05885, partial [Odoribacteraceae bacterium]|nr:hypothetical protein [Odoribacteraceae bacterium]